MSDPRPIQPDDLFAMRWLQSARLSPDGKRAVYAVTHVETTPGEADKPGEDKEYSALWLIDVESGASRQLTAGTAFDASPIWSPDGSRIAFTSTRTESRNQIFIIAVDGGEARPVTAFKQGVGGGLAWSPDGKWLTFTASPIEEPAKPDAPFRTGRFVYRFNGMEYLDQTKLDIFVVAADAAKPAAMSDARRVTDDDAMKFNPLWSPDGGQLLYAVFMPSDRYSPFYTMRITTLADDGTHAHRDLIPEWGDIYLSTWSHDGSSVVFIGKPKGSKIGSKADLFVVGSAGGTPVNRTPKLVNGVGGGLQPDFPSAGLFATPISILPDGSVIVDAQDGGMVHLYRIALDGAEKWSEIVTGERTCYLQDVRGGKILFGACDLINPPDLYVANDNGTDERRLTALNADYLANIMQPTVEHLLFRSKDDALVEGWMLKPATGSAPYPTVLYIHGGPHSGFGHAYGFDFQMLAGAGFGVLLVNHRGSTGYGDEFANAILGDWGNLDYADLMAGVDFAIAQGLTDADRLGICGLSGGGNLSTWSIGQTRRFKAAVPENPVTNWVSFYGVSDIGVWFATNELGGHPHEIPDVYHRCSPISYAHTCTTPTLLVQCEHDWRCPPEQSEQYYTVLKANGCTVEMLRVPNEPHAGCVYGGVKARRSQNDALLGWMKQYV